MRNQWPKIHAHFAGAFALPRVVSVGITLNEKADAKTYEQFFNKADTEGVVSATKQTVERMYSNAAWLARERANLVSFFNGESSSSQTKTRK